MTAAIQEQSHLNKILDGNLYLKLFARDRKCYDERKVAGGGGKQNSITLSFGSSLKFSTSIIF